MGYNTVQSRRFHEAEKRAYERQARKPAEAVQRGHKRDEERARHEARKLRYEENTQEPVESVRRRQQEEAEARKLNTEIRKIEVEQKRREAKIAALMFNAKMAQEHGLAESEQIRTVNAIQKQRQEMYGAIYKLSRMNGRAAARLYNSISDNPTSTAADVVEGTNEAGKRVIRIVDAQGHVVVDDRHGPLEWDKAVLDSMFGGKKALKSIPRGSEGLYDSSTGEVKTRKDLGLPRTDTTGGTSAQKKFYELLKLGVPPDISRGLAYGAIKQVQDLRGNTSLVDVASGHSLGTLRATTRGVEWIPAAGADEAGADVAGARKPPGDMTDDELLETLGLGHLSKEPGGGQVVR